MRVMKIELDSINIVDIENELHTLQQAVGGYIEKVKLRDGGLMIVDEEGLLKRYHRNDNASAVAGRPIFGTALIVGVDGEEFVDVPEQYISLLRLGE